MTLDYIVTIEVAPEAEAAWSRWQSEHHIPEVLAEPGFLGARKLRDTQRAADGWSRYAVVYTLESREAFDRYTNSEAAARLRQDFLAHFGEVARVTRQALEELERFSPSAKR